MKRKVIRIMVIVWVGFMVLNTGISLYATGQESKFLQKELDEIKNIQEQLNYSIQTGYVNNISGKPNKQLSQSTSSYKVEIEKLRDELTEIENAGGLTSNQLYKVLAMKRATDYLEFLDNNLVRYLKTKDGVEQFDYLRDQIVINEFLNQIIEYMERGDIR